MGYSTPAVQSQTPLGGSPMDWSPMDVSPGHPETAQETPRQRPQAAADQGATPAFVRPRPLWEAADEAAPQVAGQSVAAPAAPGMPLPSKGGLSRFAPNMPNAHDGRHSAEGQVRSSEGHAQTLAQSHQGLLDQAEEASGSGGSAGAGLGAGRASAASEASAAAAAASTAAGAAAAMAAAAAQVSDVHTRGTAATLDRLAAGAVDAAYDRQGDTAPERMAATAASSAAASASAFHGKTARNGGAAGAEAPVKPALPRKAPDLETAFRQSLHVGPQPSQPPGGHEQVGSHCRPLLQGLFASTHSVIIYVNDDHPLSVLFQDDELVALESTHVVDVPQSCAMATPATRCSIRSVPFTMFSTVVHTDHSWHM